MAPNFPLMVSLCNTGCQCALKFSLQPPLSSILTLHVISACPMAINIINTQQVPQFVNSILDPFQILYFYIQCIFDGVTWISKRYPSNTSKLELFSNKTWSSPSLSHLSKCHIPSSHVQRLLCLNPFTPCTISQSQVYLSPLLELPSFQLSSITPTTSRAP